MFLTKWLRLAGSTILLALGSVTYAESPAPSSSLPDAPSSFTPSYLMVQAPANQPPPAAPPTPQTSPAPQPANPGTPAAQQPPASQPGQTDPNGYSLKRAEHQRILGIMPEFQAVNNGAEVRPLTPGEKFHLMWKSSTDPFIFTLDGIVAGIGQAKNSNPGFGQGAQGYFKRFGASYADTFDGNFWGNAVLTVAFKEDPRYFRMGEGHSAWHRALYSAGTAVWTRRDNGKYGPNYANVIGNFISGGISNAYYPASDRGIGKTVTGAITVTAEGTIGSELIEFWPDIARKLFPKHYQQQLDQQQTAPAAQP